MPTESIASLGGAALVRALADLLVTPAVAERLAGAGVDALGADAAVVVLAEEPGPPAVSDDRTRALVETHLVTGAAPDWPAVASAGGWAAAHVVPLRADGRTVGEFVLLTAASDDPARRPAGGPWAQLLASTAATMIAHRRALEAERRRADQLQTALTSRILIEQAKGVLAERGGIDVHAAFDRLRRYARASRLRLTDVARDVVEGDVADAVLTHVRPLPKRGSILDP